MAPSTAAAPDASMRRVAAALTFFCASSLGAIFINKMCLTHFNFNYPSSLMALQGAVTIVLLSLLSRVAPSLVSIVSLKSSDYYRLLPCTLFFVANVTVGLSALSRVNIPMFSAFRRLTVLFVMAAEYVMLHRTHAPAVVISVVVLTFGAFVSALGDVTFTLVGYALVFLNNALTAAYLASIKRVMTDLHLDPTSLLYYTNVLGFPIVLCIALFTGDTQSAIYRYHTDPNLRDSPAFLTALCFVAISAFCVNLSTTICTHITSPLTTSVAGQVKNVLQSFLGFFSWGYVPTPLNVVGLLIALAGQISFAIFKHAHAKSLKTSSSSEPLAHHPQPHHNHQTVDTALLNPATHVSSRPSSKSDSNS
ncbi:unnamed protein product [Agarophyton chilense]|eukprot:gb/GEZJ01004114.1/.p1 GENE.gb/GEZJ01004114.1/~~gb/GEZJ01004114.1/.p1  ORF type:complete len:393 (-),score=50.40 gb/GEZJ01004114.1/:834-1925(-)